MPREAVCRVDLPTPHVLRLTVELRSVRQLERLPDDLALRVFDLYRRAVDLVIADVSHPDRWNQLRYDGKPAELATDTHG